VDFVLEPAEKLKDAEHHLARNVLSAARQRIPADAEEDHAAVKFFSISNINLNTY